MGTHQIDEVVNLVARLEVPIPSRADVVIVGGGIIGTSIAFHLAEAGVGNIVLIERNTLGSGSSAKPIGGIRATFSDPGNIMLGQRSLEAYESFSQSFSTDIGLQQVGYLFLCRTEAETAAIEDSVLVQRSLGGSAQMISTSEAVRLNPLLDQDVLCGASFSPRDGFAHPSRVVAAYAAAARQLGVRVLENTEVLHVGMAVGAVREILTNRGTITTQTLVIAAGAWSARLGEMADTYLPVEPVRRQIGMTGRPTHPFPTVPFTLDLSSTMYFHNYGDGMLLGISNEDQEPGFGREFSYGWVPAFDRAASIVAPRLVGSELVAGWAGLYENTPDHNAMIGRSDTTDGVIYATGFSGHGFLQGPAVGELVRDIYLDRESFMDPSPFSATRFAGSRPVFAEVHII